MPLRATRRAVTLPELPADVRSVDLCFGEDRVWSIDLDAAPPVWRRLLSGRGLAGGRNGHPWPAALTPHLRGSTALILRNSADGRELARTEVRFTDEERPARVVDETGVPLAVNKWGRLGRTLDAGDDGVQDRILDRTEEIIGHLDRMGLRPFIVGGTLLGAVRDGALLPHDDDADVAYLSTCTNPVDVAREGLAVGHRLEAFGYELVRHSATHMQLHFREPGGGVDHYVDVFAAFFTDDGLINQPFHVRGPMRTEQMLPFGSAAIAGRSFPAPADTDHWLTINYDENWRTPIPGYRLVTPLDTRRRFENWFGLFNSDREFWDDRHRRGADETGSGTDWILHHAPELRAGTCIDLGCGTGSLGAALRNGPGGAREGASGSHAAEFARRIVAADYSRAAFEAVAARGDSGIHPATVNLLQLDALALPRDAGIKGAFDLVADHVLDQVDPQAVPQALRLIRMALRSGGTVLATCHARRDPDRPDADPTNRFLPHERLRRLAAPLGLDVEITPLAPRSRERR
ncbi:LicD family protein, partial [Leucobacter soli]